MVNHSLIKSRFPVILLLYLTFLLAPGMALAEKSEAPLLKELGIGLMKKAPLKVRNGNPLQKARYGFTQYCEMVSGKNVPVSSNLRNRFQELVRQGDASKWTDRDHAANLEALFNGMGIKQNKAMILAGNNSSIPTPNARHVALGVVYNGKIYFFDARQFAGRNGNYTGSAASKWNGMEASVWEAEMKKQGYVRFSDDETRWQTRIADVLVKYIGSKTTPRKAQATKGGIRKFIKVTAFGWATYDRIVHANGTDWGSRWVEWGTRGNEILIPEGTAFSVLQDQGSPGVHPSHLELSGEITKEKIVWLKVKYSYPYMGGDQIGEEFELEIQDLPVQPDSKLPITGYSYIADSVIQDTTRPHNVVRFIKKLTYERTYNTGQKQVLNNVDWNHLSGPQTRGCNPYTECYSPYNQNSFVSVNISYATPEGGPAPAP